MRTISRKDFRWILHKRMIQSPKERFEHAVSEFKNLKGKEKFWFISGFVDGEGSFNISFARVPQLATGFIINPKFQVYQHKDYEEILIAIRDTFGAGRIDSKWGTDVRVLTIENRKTIIEKIIPFFRRFPLVTKRNAFEIFCEAINRMERGDHLTLQGYLNLIELVYDMNQNGKARKYEKEELKELVKNNFFQRKNPQRLHAEPPLSRRREMI